jgi:hypothetical protein
MEWILTFSSIWRTVDSFALKIRLFCSCHTTKVQHSQSNCMKERRARLPPAEWTNCTKWLWWSLNGSVEDVPTQWRTKPHKEAKTGQDKNKWCAYSTPPQPDTHSWESCAIILRRTKLSLVGSLLRSSRQANTDNFRGTCLCHSNSIITAAPGASLCVSKS